MRNSPKLPAAFLAAGLLLGSSAQALEWQAGIGADVRWFDWREHVRERQAVMEFGPLLAPVAQLQVNQGRLFAQVESAWGGGIVRYDGHLQGKPGEILGPPYESEAWEEIIDSELRIGWLGDRGNVHVGYLQRDWRRFIDGSANVSSAEERYRWRFLTLGGEAPLLSSPRWRVALNLGIPTESYQKVYAGSVDDFTLEPGAGFFWRLSFPLRPGSEGRHALIVEPYFQQQNMQASDPVLQRKNGVSTGEYSYQPESIRRELGVVLRWRLGGSAD